LRVLDWPLLVNPSEARIAYGGADDSGGIEGELPKGLPEFELPLFELPKDEFPKDELPNGELPTGVVVLLAGWPINPVLPPPICFMSERGS
jgi:hypothetical protein